MGSCHLWVQSTKEGQGERGLQVGAVMVSRPGRCGCRGLELCLVRGDKKVVHFRGMSKGPQSCCSSRGLSLFQYILGTRAEFLRSHPHPLTSPRAVLPLGSGLSPAHSGGAQPVPRSQVSSCSNRSPLCFHRCHPHTEARCHSPLHTH